MSVLSSRKFDLILARGCLEPWTSLFPSLPGAGVLQPLRGSPLHSRVLRRQSGLFGSHVRKQPKRCRGPRLRRHVLIHHLTHIENKVHELTDSCVSVSFQKIRDDPFGLEALFCADKIWTRDFTFTLNADGRLDTP